jgi:GH24 family phage-related lysozyme (muramidase)
MSHDKQECSDANDDDIRSIEGSELTMETASIGTGTIGDGNAHGNESTLMNTLQQVPKPIL